MLMTLAFLIVIATSCVLKEGPIHRNIRLQFLSGQAEGEKIDTTTWQKILPFPVDSIVLLGAHYPEQDAKLLYNVDKRLSGVVICYKNGKCIHRELFGIFVEEGSVSMFSSPVFWSDNDSDYRMTVGINDSLVIGAWHNPNFCLIKPLGWGRHCVE